MNEARAKVLQVNNLSISFFTDRGGIRAIQEVSFTVRTGGITIPGVPILYSGREPRRVLSSI